MKVSFHATIRDAAGVADIQINAGTLAELMDRLGERFGSKFKDMLIKEGELRDDVVILVNGQNIAHLNGLGTHLTHEDDVAIFPPVSGG